MPDVDTVTPSEAARLLGVTRQAVHTWMARGRLPTVKVTVEERRIPRAAVEAMANGERKAGRPVTPPPAP